ncbi:malate synthase A [Sungkyunkwania multivorans]|uniref:Malate synthase n=1 Tax=Sungkyunkwania multivorans TaxID=1173618 RepID=A0ABW3CVH3_9FLAO
MENITMTTHKIQFAKGVQQYFPEVLTDEALDFLATLHERFNTRRLSLLRQRELQQFEFDKGKLPTFPAETADIRNSEWTAGSIPTDLIDRRVEITGPVDRKMVINALNSGAKTFMADFEDSNAPSWINNIKGQQNLSDAIDGTIYYYDPVKDKPYKLKEETATLIVRPRGLHLQERHLLIGNEEAAGSLVDFGLYVFHNARKLIAQGSGPYFYLPKLEHYLEARWWNDVFIFAQEYLGVPKGTIKATVLIETITASFQLDEIIFELKDHIVGLNCGRWDYIFSYIKKLKGQPNFVVPIRDQVTMETPFMSAYSKLVIQRCHKRGIHAMGGMAAQIPIKGNPEANEAAMDKVRKDKEREVKNGHDGTWVAHPGLVALAKKVFDENMPTANQIHVKRADLKITEADLLERPSGTITEEGIRKNINVAILYIEAWLRGNGAVALYHLMEDAATAEISRTQVWQWLHSRAYLADGRQLDMELYVQLFEDEVRKLKVQVGKERFENGQFENAIALFEKLVVQEEFEEFLTLPAYKLL